MNIRYFTIVHNAVHKTILTDAIIKANNKEMRVSALWDTGANSSCVSHNVAKVLELEAISKIEMRTPGNSDPIIVDGFIVNIELPNKVKLENIQVYDSEIGKQKFDLLIGMDIISLGDFAISNYNNKTIFSYRYPSCEDINFVNEARMKVLMKNNTHGQGKRKKKK